jgi:hypothetical protein
MAHKHATDCPIPDDLCSAYKEQQRIANLLELNPYDIYEEPRNEHFNPALSLRRVIAFIRNEPLDQWWLTNEEFQKRTGMGRPQL